MADVNRGRGRGRGRGGRGRGVDPEEEEPRRRDQRDLEIAAMGRRIRELERQLAEARMDSTNEKEGEELETLDSSEVGTNSHHGVVAKLKANQSQDRRMRHGTIESVFEISKSVVCEDVSFDFPPIFDKYPAEDDDDDDDDVFIGMSESEAKIDPFENPAIFDEELVDDLLLSTTYPTTFEKNSILGISSLVTMSALYLSKKKTMSALFEIETLHLTHIEIMSSEYSDLFLQPRPMLANVRYFTFFSSCNTQFSVVFVQITVLCARLPFCGLHHSILVSRSDSSYASYEAKDEVADSRTNLFSEGENDAINFGPV